MASPSTRIAASKVSGEATEGAPFRSAAEHLQAELDYLKLLLHRQVLRLRAVSLLREDQFRGLYISDEEIDAILLRTAAGDQQSQAQGNSRPTLRGLAVSIAAAEVEIASRLESSRAAGINIPLLRLARLFELSPFEQLVVLITIAPEVDTRFETLYSYVQNDVTKKRPTPDLISKLFCSSIQEYGAMRAMLSASAKLLSVPLLRFGADPPDREPSFLSRPLHAEQRIVGFLLEQNELDERLRPFASIKSSARSFADLHLPESLTTDLQNAGRSLAAQGGLIFLHGPKGCGKRTAAEAICLDQHRRVISAQLDQLASDHLPLPLALRLLQREALLQDSNLLLNSPDLPWSSDVVAQQKKIAFFESLAPRPFLIFVASRSQISLADTSAKCASLSFAVPPPCYSDRELLWREAIEAMKHPISPDVDIAALANKFLLTGGEIHSICREAAGRANLRKSGEPVFLADIEAAARGQSNQGLRRLAQKVNCMQDWPDLILPARSVRQLREVCASEKYRHVVYSQWGYDRRLALGKGLNALFCGPSGTGKTMAAGIIARALALDLYKIDLSSVVSKYIGETEKQLSQIFHEAGSSNAILFFDEADALFGKRSEVKDAHDRYANVEVAYLLQKMEEYEGIVILATNFRRNLDEAFTRRMHHIVEFPFPDADLREQIWKSLVPPGAPLAADVNFGFLARQFELSGGNIRNVALAAAFLAAECGGEIRMEHFVRATAREFQKLGRLPSRAEFREYYDLLRASA
jgi:SpoVK/Ycf46/Vps4 family AAA+-type ATPase